MKDLFVYKSVNKCGKIFHLWKLLPKNICAHKQFFPQIFITGEGKKCVQIRMKNYRCYFCVYLDNVAFVMNKERDEKKNKPFKFYYKVMELCHSRWAFNQWWWRQFWRISHVTFTEWKRFSYIGKISDFFCGPFVMPTQEGILQPC